MALSFNTTQNNPATDSSDCIVIGAFSDKTFNAAGQQLDAASNGRLAALAARGDISGKIGQTVLLQDIAATDAALPANINLLPMAPAEVVQP